MRCLLALLVVVAFGRSPAAAQDALPACETLLSAAEIRSTCSVADATVDITQGTDGRCLTTAQRPGSVSTFTLNVYVDENPQVAAATVDLARALGQAADQSRSGAGASGERVQVLGQVFEALGAQDPSAAPAEAVSADEARTRDLPGLGDGGVRYVSEAASGIGLVTHAVVFTSGATVVKLESGIVAGRAGVCAVGTLEALARRIAGRL
ncbi:hypothetical protein [Rubrivirga sp. IMCC43871]|uniref:hypothetical protein n=1 Tax=Rubrivirga sp. IMCC43871 TaxID=3391575 RepID=UPI00398FDA67